MDTVSWQERIIAGLKKYKYVLAVLALGVVFMLIPQRKETQPEPVVAEETEQTDMQTELARILSKIQGAGRVEVLLTQAAGEEILYQMDTDESFQDSSSDIGQKTVIITGSDRAQQAVVRQILPPTYLGAVVVCQGGDQPAVQLAIVEAVSNATGLSTDKITVLKMK